MALGPIDYTLDVQNPLQSVLQGYQAGAAIRNDQAQMRQQQLAQQQAQMRQQLLAGLAAKQNATADDYASVMTQLPDLAENLQKAWTTRNAAQQQAHANDLLQWGAAIKSGRPELAERQILERADAMEAANGGQPTPESKALRTNAQVLAQSPQFALGQIQAMLASNPNGKQAADALASFGSEQRAQELQPSAVTKAVADASTAQSTAQKTAIDAKYAEQNAVRDLEKKGWDIRAIQEDIGFKREANRIAAMNAAANREGNALKREELSLKVQEARNSLDEKIRAKVADTESSAANIDNSLNTIRRIKNSQGMRDVVGSFEGNRFYPNQLAAAVNTLNPFTSSGDDRADAIALIETLGSQAFLSQAANLKGMGALSNAEGEKLQSALTNLSRQQSEKQFLANLDEAERLLQKGRATLSKRTGVPLGAPDIPARTPLPSGAAPAAPGASLRTAPPDGRPPLDSFFTPGT